MNFPEALSQINHCIKWKVKNTILPRFGIFGSKEWYQ